MKGYVNEQLLEARRRAVLHARVRGHGAPIRLAVRRDDVEAEIAERQPTGAVILYMGAVLAGALGTLFVIWFPRLIGWLMGWLR